nr:hypothetical protein [Tanacetum cinerariifolium]
MTSFGYRFNPRYAIKECSSCGTLYTRDCVCSIGTVEDKILIPKPPNNCAQCTRCGYLVDGPNCQGCALLGQELEENLVTYSPDFQNSSKPSNASTNVVNAPREPNVAKQDNGSFVDKIIFRAPDSPDQFHCFHCKDVLRAGETYKRCTCAKCRSGLGKGLCYICGHNPNSLNNSPIFLNLLHKVLRISTIVAISEPCNNQTIDELPQALPIFHPTFHSEAESSFTVDPTPTYVDESPNVFNPPPQPSVYHCEFCRNDAYYGHYCTPQAPLIYPEQCYNQDFNFQQKFQDVPQQYLCCDDCGVTHDAYQCQPMTEVYYYGQNSCYDSTSIGFDQSEPQQYTIEEEQAAKAQYWKPPVCYDDDDDEESSKSLKDNIIYELPPCVAVTPNEPVDFLIMGDEHLNTIPAMESDEFIESCVENLVPNPSESEDKNGCDMPPECTTFLKVLCDAECESDSSDNQSPSDEDVLETIVSNLIEKLLYDNSSPRPPEEF